MSGCCVVVVFVVNYCKVETWKVQRTINETIKFDSSFYWIGIHWNNKHKWTWHAIVTLRTSSPCPHCPLPIMNHCLCFYFFLHYRLLRFLANLLVISWASTGRANAATLPRNPPFWCAIRRFLYMGTFWLARTVRVFLCLLSRWKSLWSIGTFPLMMFKHISNKPFNCSSLAFFNNFLRCFRLASASLYAKFSVISKRVAMTTAFHQLTRFSLNLVIYKNDWPFLLSLSQSCCAV